ncbi:transient receptor potential cation channel subfamily M member 5, partial [Biomphalaria glabrata]
CCQELCTSPKQCLTYFFDPFNILDNLSLTIAFTAWALRWMAFVFPEEDRLMIAARYFMGLDFMLYMFRFLEFFYQNKFLGPILVVIRNMVNTYINFLLILTIFLVTYSIVSESILYPEQELNVDIFHKVFHIGFWAMMGDYSLDKLESSKEDCQMPQKNESKEACPTTHGKYSISIFLGAYVLFIQILMFNLLIALFNNAISENDIKRDMIWRYQRFQLTKQYSGSKILLPPFLLLIFVLCDKCNNPFKSKESKRESELKDFERGAVQKFINRIAKGSFGREVSDDDKKNKDKEITKMAAKIAEILQKKRQESAEPETADKIDTQSKTSGWYFTILI